MDKDKDYDEELDEELEPDTDNEDIDDDDENVDDNSQDDEFEYDEDGNIIIPDVVDEDDEEEKEADENNQDEKTDENKDEGLNKSDEVVEPDTKKPDERDEKIAKLEQELKALKTQGKETLSKLGVSSDDVLEGLERLAAESDDIPLDEYKKNKAADERNTAALEMLQRAEFEKKMAADLAEVQAAYPETKKYSKMTEIDNFVKFGKFRDLGLSPKEAYAAANPDGVRQDVANAVKQKTLNNKEHLQSAVPKGSKDSSVVMPKKTLAEWRDLFPNKSDKELIELYKKTI